MDPASKASSFTKVLAQVPGTDGLVREAIDLQAASDAQAAENERMAGTQGYGYDASRASNQATPSFAAPPKPSVPGTNIIIEPRQAIAKIYPLLVFRDKVVRTISGIVSKIPGLEKAIETISEKVTLFIMGLLAPYIKPIIASASNALKQGSGTVVDASAKQQYLVWTDPTSSDPTHSMLSKDHFSNILNTPAGQVAAAILQYVAPRVIYGWDHPEVPEQEILNDIGRVFHHPAIRDQHLEVHREMFSVVEKWAHSRPHGAADLNHILGSESVKAGHNHTVQNVSQSVHGLESHLQHSLGTSSHSATAGGPLANFLGGGGRRGLDLDDETPDPLAYGTYEQSAMPAQDYSQGSWGQQPSQPAGFVPGDVNAYPTAYQQGYEAPYDPPQQQQYNQQGYQQGGYGDYEQSQGYGGAGYGGYDQGSGYDQGNYGGYYNR